MADSRFFKNQGPFKLAEIAKICGAELAKNADPNRSISDVAPLDTASKDHLSFLDNPKYTEAFGRSKAGAVITHPKHAGLAPEGMALLLTDQPYLAYALAAQAFYPTSATVAGVQPGAHIHPTAQLDTSVAVASGAWIGANAILGAGVEISAGAVIHPGVIIGENTRIGANTVISHSIIGKRVIIHPNTSIGQDGFGFAKGSKGLVKVPQLGRVIIEDDVEIGAGSCIDRGAGPDTVIGMGAKIDNLVQIGHNVKVGRFATLVSQVGVAGSAEIGDGAILAGQVGVAGHLRIGTGAVLAAKSGVTKSIPDGAAYGGFPAMPMMEWRRQQATMNRLTKKKETGKDD